MASRFRVAILSTVVVLVAALFLDYMYLNILPVRVFSPESTLSDFWRSKLDFSKNISHFPTSGQEDKLSEDDLSPGVHGQSDNNSSQAGALRNHSKIPPKPHESCAVKKTFLKCCRPVTALASFPGSGNTWVRHLLEEATGHYTGSVYHSGILLKAGFKGEGTTNGRVVAVKTHLYRKARRIKYDKVLLLTRSPFDCLTAEFNRQKVGKTGVARKDTYIKKWPSFFKKQLAKWHGFHEYWYSQAMPTHVVQYEDLKTDLRGELKRMLAFLDLPVSEERLDCVIRNSEGQFHRKPRNDSFDPYTDRMKTKVWTLVKEVEDLKKRKIAKQKLNDWRTIKKRQG